MKTYGARSKEQGARGRVHDQTGGLYAAGNHPGFFLIGLLTALILPFFSNVINKTGEKKKIVTILTAISDLKKKCISYLEVGEIDAEGNELVFFLDNREIRRMFLPQLQGISGKIYFNRYGITAGGEILIKFSKRYRIVIEEVSGRIRVE